MREWRNEGGGEEGGKEGRKKRGRDNIYTAMSGTLTPHTPPQYTLSSVCKSVYTYKLYCDHYSLVDVGMCIYIKIYCDHYNLQM